MQKPRSITLLYTSKLSQIFPFMNQNGLFITNKYATTTKHQQQSRDMSIYIKTKHISIT